MKILIIGAGLGGLTLANALRQLVPKADVHLFERDAAAETREQGYGITLYPEGGLWALSKLGLLETIQAYSQPATELVYYEPNGDRLACRAALSQMAWKALGVYRPGLRRLLLEKIPTHWIHYGKRCQSYQIFERSAVVSFEDGSHAEGDVVVVCDGSKSLLRDQMLGNDRQFLGISTIGGIVAIDPLPERLKNEAFMTLGLGCSAFVFGNRKEPTTVLWGITLHSNLDALRSIEKGQLKHIAQKTTEGWHSPIPELIEKTPLTHIGVQDLYDRPPAKHLHQGPVVLLGDAAHPMSPFLGQGGNSAMRDAVELALLLGNDENLSLEEKLKLYEHEVLGRTTPLVQRSHRNARLMHTSDPKTYENRNRWYQYRQKKYLASTSL